jgi:uncharacterized protein YjiS (DUF1127 family)
MPYRFKNNNRFSLLCKPAHKYPARSTAQETWSKIMVAKHAQSPAYGFAGAASNGGFAVKAETVLRRSLRWLGTELETRRAVEELRALDDHALADIGITRLDIERKIRLGR